MVMRYLSFLVFCLCTGLAVAAGDANTGKSVAVICIGCHGSDGNSDNPIYLKLAGQAEAYLVKQLNDFKSGARREEHMTSMVEAIDVADIPHVAAYFASQKRKRSSVKTVSNKLGEKIFHTGLKDRNIPACAGCHGPNALGNTAAGIPSLAAQHVEYVSKSLRDFRSTTRNNDAQKMMRNVVRGLSYDEIEAVAVYVSGLP